MPNVEVSIMTDIELDSGPFDRVIPVTNPDYSFRDQITLLPESPYDRTLYLDSDIYVYEDILEVFDLLDQFDVAMAEIQVSPRWDLEGVPESFYGYNTGVVAYNNTEDFAEFCRDWEANV